MAIWVGITHLELGASVVGGNDQAGAGSVSLGLDISSVAGVGDLVCAVEN